MRISEDNGAVPVDSKHKKKPSTSKLRPTVKLPSATGIPESAAPLLSESTRGQKRDRDEQSVAGDDADRPPARKRGREQGQSRGEVMDEGVAIDPLCGNRKIGEEWGSGSTKFKVGPDGRRLQRGTVKEKRQKYRMVSDALE